jgi:hypothetical protein
LLEGSVIIDAGKVREIKKQQVVMRWPGQVERGILDLAQVRALASPARSEVYYAFSAEEPMSTSEVAVSLRRAAPTVRYHVNELVKANLLLDVETRKRHARTESAYVHSMVYAFTARPPYPPEYLEEIHKGFGAILRTMERERKTSLAVAQIDPGFYDFVGFRHNFITLPADQLARFKSRMYEVLEEFEQYADPEGILTHVVSYISPVIAESLPRLNGEDPDATP